MNGPVTTQPLTFAMVQATLSAALRAAGPPHLSDGVLQRRRDIQAILRKYGAENISAVPCENYGQLLADLDDLTAKRCPHCYGKLLP